MDNREKFDFDSGYMDASETARQNLADIGITEIADKDTFFQTMARLVGKADQSHQQQRSLEKAIATVEPHQKIVFKNDTFSVRTLND